MNPTALHAPCFNQGLRRRSRIAAPNARASALLGALIRAVTVRPHPQARLVAKVALLPPPHTSREAQIPDQLRRSERSKGFRICDDGFRGGSASFEIVLN